LLGGLVIQQGTTKRPISFHHSSSSDEEATEQRAVLGNEQVTIKVQEQTSFAQHHNAGGREEDLGFDVAVATKLDPCCQLSVCNWLRNMVDVLNISQKVPV
jgi:hypothetical protein